MILHRGSNHASVKLCERFEVADPAGGALVLNLLCASPREHYDLCVKAKLLHQDRGSAGAATGGVSAPMVEDAAAEGGLVSPAGGCSAALPEEGSAEIDCTGLRVYEGAQVMAAFVAACARDCFRPWTSVATDDGSARPGETVLLVDESSWLRPPLFPSVSVAPPFADQLLRAAGPTWDDDVAAVDWVVELGCGCGLSGLTAAAFFPEANVVLTDAAPECLSLVSDSIAHQNPHVFPPKAPSPSRQLRCAPLLWSEAGAKRLYDLLAPTRVVGSDRSSSMEPSAVSGYSGSTADAGNPRAPRVRIVLGSDIMYYRVDVHELLSTCKVLLLQGNTPESSSGGRSEEDRWGVVALAHYMRLPDGQSVLRCAARQLGFHVAQVPLETFIQREEVLQRGWGGMELVILLLDRRAHDGQSSGATSEFLAPCTGVCQCAAAEARVVRRIFREAFAHPRSLSAACAAYATCGGSGTGGRLVGATASGVRGMDEDAWALRELPFSL